MGHNIIKDYAVFERAVDMNCGIPYQLLFI